MNDLITQAQAARLAAVTRQRIWTLAQTGRFPVIRVAGVPFLRRSDIEHYITQRRQQQ